MKSKLSRGVYGFCVLAAFGVGACSQIFETTPDVHVRPLAQTPSQADAANSGYYQSAVSAIENRDYATALDYLQAARETHPNDVRILNAFGVVYDKLGRFDLSARYYAQASAVEPGSHIVAKNVEYSKILQGLQDAPQLPQMAFAQPELPRPNLPAVPEFTIAAVPPAVPKMSVPGFAVEVGVLDSNKVASNKTALDLSSKSSDATGPAFPLSVPADTVISRPTALTLPSVKPVFVRAADERVQPSKFVPDLSAPQLITSQMPSQETLGNSPAAVGPAFQLPISVGFMRGAPVEAVTPQVVVRPVAFKLAERRVQPSKLVLDLAIPILNTPQPVSMSIVERAEPAVPALPALVDSSPIIPLRTFPTHFVVKPLAMRVAARKMQPSSSNLDLATLRLPQPLVEALNVAEAPASAMYAVPSFVATQRTSSVVATAAKPIKKATMAPAISKNANNFKAWEILAAEPQKKAQLALQNHLLVKTTTIGVPRAIHSLPNSAGAPPNIQTAAGAGKALIPNIAAVTKVAGITGFALVVLNGSGNANAVEPVRHHLGILGWTVSRLPSPNVRAQQYTTISFPRGSAVAARALMRTLPFSVRLAEVNCRCGVQLTVGSDFQGWKVVHRSVPGRVHNGPTLAALLPVQTKGGY